VPRRKSGAASDRGERNGDLKGKCAALHARLKQLSAVYEQKIDDLPGPFLFRVDLGLYQDLLGLASEGLRIVQGYRVQFPVFSLYSDGMFWYDLFQFINAAGGRVWKNKDEVNIPQGVTATLADILVDVSWFSTATGGDIEQRNLEALASTLLAFGNDELERELRRKARTIRLKRVDQFMKETFRTVARYRKD